MIARLSNEAIRGGVASASTNPVKVQHPGSDPIHIAVEPRAKSPRMSSRAYKKHFPRRVPLSMRPRQVAPWVRRQVPDQHPLPTATGWPFRDSQNACRWQVQSSPADTSRSPPNQRYRYKQVHDSRRTSISGNGCKPVGPGGRPGQILEPCKGSRNESGRNLQRRFCQKPPLFTCSSISSAVMISF